MIFSLSEPNKVPSKKIKLVDSNLNNLELAEVPNKVHSKLIRSHVLKIKSNILDEHEYLQSTMKHFCVNETIVIRNG